MARQGPTFGHVVVGDTWAVGEWALHGDTPRALRVFENPHDPTRTREVDVETTGWNWTGLRSGTVMNLRVDCLYENPQEEKSSFAQIHTLNAPPPGLRPVEGLRARATWDLVTLEWDRHDPRTTTIEVLRDGPDGHVALVNIAVHEGTSLSHTDARIQPDRRYVYTLRSRTDSGETADARVSVMVPAPPPAPPPAQWSEPESVSFGMLARPAAVSRGPQSFNLFWFEGTSKRIRHRAQDWGVWRDSELLQLQPLELPTAEIAATSLGQNHIDLVYGIDGGDIRHAWWDGGAWYEETPFDHVTAIPASVAIPGWLHYFFRTEQGTLGHVSWEQGAGWDQARDVGGTVAGRPAAAAWGPYRVDVLARSPGGTLLHRTYDPHNDTWSAETDLGGRVATNPTATCSAGWLHVLYRNPEGQLMHRYWSSNSSWSAEVGVGSVLTGSPTAISWPGRTDVFYLHAPTPAESFIWHRWLD